MGKNSFFENSLEYYTNRSRIITTEFTKRASKSLKKITAQTSFKCDVIYIFYDYANK